MAVDDSIRIFSGSAHPALANDVAAYLELPLAKCHIDRFADGEVHFVIGESVRGKDVYVIQSLRKPVNDFVVEMLVMIDALRRASARSITAVLPYFAYARQDRQDRPRTPISARLMADLLQAAGVHRVMAMDLHAGQIQGFFDVPVDHLNAGQVLLEAMRRVGGDRPDGCVIVSPDAGGVERARRFSTRIGGSGLAIIDKRRSKPNVAEVMHVVGDVSGRDAFVVDDIIDTAGTLCGAARALRENGARSVSAFASHGLFNGAAIERIMASDLDKVFVTNTIPPTDEVKACPKIEVLSVAATVGEAIKRVHGDFSVSSLFWY
jgi:ribose-phosphate pyrophosphokinase